MGGEAFWKRLTAFCLTFGLGVFLSNNFTLKEKPSENALQLAPKRENCVPADANLKYLPLKEKSEVSEEELKRIEAEKSNAEPQLYIPERDKAEYKILLHKEKCYESDGRK